MKKVREFSAASRKIIRERDEDRCIFCEMGYHMEKAKVYALTIKGIMHYIPRSKGGLGVPENGAIGCQYHHHMLDNGKDGHRKEMLEIFKEYLMQQYPNWDEKKLVYSKWRWLNG